MAFLQSGGVFEAVAGDDAVVGVGGGDEGSGINGSRFQIMVRRIGVEGFEFFGVVGGSIVIYPEASGGEFLKSEHVHNPDGGETSAKEVGTLIHTSADEETAVATASDGEFGGFCVTVFDQPFGGGNEVVKDVLFAEFGAGFVPSLAVFAAAAKVCLGIDAAHFHPGKVADGEAGRQRDVEASVAVKKGWRGAVWLKVFLMADEHGNASAVFTMIEDLFNKVVVGVERNFWPADELAFAGQDIVAVDAGRRVDAGK